MKKQKTEAKINLEALAGGAFAEKLNEALIQVADNIQNPNTEATTKRQINVTIKFAPNKTRQLVNTQIAVTTKLAATEAIDTQMIMGVNMRTGQLEIAEYDGQIRGQMSLSDLTQPQEKPEPAAGAGDTQQAKAAETAAGTKEQEAAEPDPAGKPLDLKNRKKNQEPEKAEAAAGDLVPGRDFDSDTGEILKDGHPVDDQKKIVAIGQRAAQA